MDPDQETLFGLRFESRIDSDGSHVIPVHNLVQALEGLQRTIHLVAMMNEKKEIKSRARVPREIEDRFQLHCNVSEKGSFYQSTFIAAKNLSLLSPQDAQEVARITRSLLGAIGSGKDEEQNFKNEIVDSAFRAPIIASLGKMFGCQELNYRLTVEDKSGNPIVESGRANNALERLRQARLSPGTHSIVTGYISKVDFKEHKLSLLIPSTGRLISCIYEDDVEPVILDNRRDLIQLVGTIELDEDGNPLRITDVQEVHPVDTDDINIVDLAPEYLKVSDVSDCRVAVELSEDKQTYFARCNELGIDHAAFTRSDLIDALKDEIAFLWQHIAKEDDDRLSPKARLLKVKLMEIFEEI